MFEDARGLPFDDDQTRFLVCYIRQAQQDNGTVQRGPELRRGYHQPDRLPPVDLPGQLFIVQPVTVIPNHTLPNVESYEAFLHGINITPQEQVTWSGLDWFGITERLTTVNLVGTK